MVRERERWQWVNDSAYIQEDGKMLAKPIDV